MAYLMRALTRQRREVLTSYLKGSFTLISFVTGLPLWFGEVTEMLLLN